MRRSVQAHSGHETHDAQLARFQRALQPVKARGPFSEAWINCTAPLRDSHDLRFSLTKILAVYFALLDWHSVEKTATHELSANQLWLAIVCIAAAFGKSTFNFLLKRLAMRSSLSASSETRTERRDENKNVNVKIDATRRLIESKRDDETGEPLPDAPGQEVDVSKRQGVTDEAP